MKMIIHNKGYKIEEEMIELFKGSRHVLDCIDFQTDTHFYEVKSCNLLINCTSHGNPKLKTDQLGRFFIKKHNHIALKELADKENKKAEYIFVIVVGTQKIWKTMGWEKVNLMIDTKKENVPLRINKIFKNELRLK